jgi:hypothetical protein
VFESKKKFVFRDIKNKKYKNQINSKYSEQIKIKKIKMIEINFGVGIGINIIFGFIYCFSGFNSFEIDTTFYSLVIAFGSYSSYKLLKIKRKCKDNRQNIYEISNYIVRIMLIVFFVSDLYCKNYNLSRIYIDVCLILVINNMFDILWFVLFNIYNVEYGIYSDFLVDTKRKNRKNL